MARLPRLTVPGYPHHIIQRGNNRQAIFAANADYETLLAMLDEHARKLQDRHPCLRADEQPLPPAGDARDR